MKTPLSALAMCAMVQYAIAGATVPIIETQTASNRHVSVTAVTDNIIKVTNTSANEQPKPSQLILTPLGSADADVTDNNAFKTVTTAAGLSARLDSRSGAVTISDTNGHGLYDDGHRGRDTQGHRTLNLLPLDNTEVFYGGGERGYTLNLANDTLVMYNQQNYGYTDGDPRIKQMNITMPLLLSPNGYAILVDDYAAAELTTGKPLHYASESPDDISYYFISSPEGFAKLPEQVSTLTGRQALPPFWSLGYITSKYGYKTAAETDSVVNALKKAGYPLDGIVLDLYWYGKEEDMGRLDWEPMQWGDHRKMLSSLKKKGVNLTAISQPYVLRNGKGIDNYREMSAKGMFGKDSVGGVKNVEIWVGEGGMLDVSNPDTRIWLRERYKRLTDEGVTGWWGDLGEPEKHPEGMYHANGLTTRQYHNLYGNDWSRIIHDLFKEEYPGTRLMTLMRGGTIGLQRYSVFPWSTDVSRSWGGLQPQVRIMLNSGLSGLGYMSHDVGGFAIDKENPIDPELYVRWLQLGTFSPILRTHSQEYAEPYHYPAQQHIILPLIKARYQWLPYNYTLAYENTTQGTPLVRPVGMYETEPAAFDGIDDQYLWGRDVMIAPVIRQGARSRQVRFPSGAWVDYNDPSRIIQGDTTITVEAPLETLPMFVRAGALIPKAMYRMENTLQYNPADYTVEYYPVPGQEPSATSFTIFEDDRTSPSSLEKNEYALVRLDADNTSATINLSASVSGTYPGIPLRRNITFVLHNVAKPLNVTATEKVKQHYDAATRILRVTVPRWNSSAPLSVTVTKQ